MAGTVAWMSAPMPPNQHADAMASCLAGRATWGRPASAAPRDLARAAGGGEGSMASSSRPLALSVSVGSQIERGALPSGGGDRRLHPVPRVLILEEADGIPPWHGQLLSCSGRRQPAAGSPRDTTFLEEAGRIHGAQFRGFQEETAAGSPSPDPWLFFFRRFFKLGIFFGVFEGSVG